MADGHVCVYSQDSDESAEDGMALTTQIPIHPTLPTTMTTTTTTRP